MGPKKFIISGSSTSAAPLGDSNPEGIRTGTKRFSPKGMMRRLPNSRDLPPIDAASEKVVYIDEATGDPIEAPRFPGFRRNVSAYLVSSEQQLEREKLVCHLKDVITNQALGIAVNCVATCHLSREDQVVRALHRYESPTAGLDLLIERWIKEFHREQLGRQRDLITGFYEMRSDLQSYLVNRALEQAGLDLRLEMALELEALDLLKDFEVEALAFPVRVRGYNEEVKVTLDAVFAINPEKKIQAALAYGELPRLANKLVDWTRAFMLTRATIEDFYADASDRLRDRLDAHLTERLDPEGRLVTFLQLASDLSALTEPEFFQFKLSLDCTVGDCPEPITVDQELLMDLENPAKYRLAGGIDLDEWAEKELDKVSRIVLLPKKYADVILDIERIQQDIREQVASGAARIGYRIQHLVVIPDLEPLVLNRDGFRIEETRQFATKDTDEGVKLRIVFSGKLGDLNAIRGYLRPQTNLKEELQRTLLTSVKDASHGIEEERFYMRFSSTEVPEETPVEQLLGEAVSRDLIEKFHITDANLTINRVDTEVTERLKALRSDVHSLEVEATPLRSGEPIRFQCTFKIISVDSDGWYAFRANKYPNIAAELEALTKVLHDDIRAKLDTVPVELLRYGDIKELRDILTVIAGSVALVKRTFGLVIEFVSFRRRLSASEGIDVSRQQTDRKIASDRDAARKDMVTMQIRADQELLKSLHNQRKNILATMGDDEESEELEAIDKRIKSIEEKAGIGPQIEQGNNVPRIEGQTERPFSLEDYRDRPVGRITSDGEGGED